MKRIFPILLLFFYPASTQAVDQAYGKIEYVSGANALNATMDPNGGGITCNNASDYTCPLFGTPGSFLIPGTSGQQVDLRCRKSPEISNGTTILKVRNATIHVDGVSAACNGKSRSIHTHTLTGNQAQDTVYIGARLRVTNGQSGGLTGVFNTINAGGQNHSIRYLYI